LPYEIHEEALKKQGTVNVMRPQEPVPSDLPPNFGGTMSQGLPVRQIPHREFPCIVYKHPNEPFRTIEHRNTNFEVVGTEVVQTEALTKKVENQGELEAALADGWVRELYVPKPLPDPTAHLYEQRRKKQQSA
jgi:hypothetical protein